MVRVTTGAQLPNSGTRTGKEGGSVTGPGPSAYLYFAPHDGLCCLALLSRGLWVRGRVEVIIRVNVQVGSGY